MGPIGHFSAGLAANLRFRGCPLGFCSWPHGFSMFLPIAFGFAGIERGGDAGLPSSHGLFMSVIWSVVAALLARTRLS